MGLAAVTEANYGDFTVKLKNKRSRGIDEVIADVRAQIKTAEPALDVEFTQVLQDKIGDLSNAPEPIQIKLFSEDPPCSTTSAPASPPRSRKSTASSTSRTASTTPSAAPPPTSRSIPSLAGRLGFTPQEVAEDATSHPRRPHHHRPPHRQRPPLHHPRPPRRRDPRLARHHPRHRLQLAPPATPPRSAP